MRHLQIENRSVRFVVDHARNSLYFGGVFITQNDACLDLNDFSPQFPPLSGHHKMQSMFCREDRIHRSGAPVPARHTHIASRDMASTVVAGPAGGRSAGPWISGALILDERLPAGQTPLRGRGSRRARRRGDPAPFGHPGKRRNATDYLSRRGTDNRVPWGRSGVLKAQISAFRVTETQRFTTRQSCPRALSAVQSSSALARSGKYPAWTR